MEFYTERLQIRPVEIGDSKSMFNYRSDPETHQYLSSIPETVEDVKEFIGRTATAMNIPGTWYQFVVIEQKSNTLIGDVGVHFLETDSENLQAEIGYTLHRHYRGKGFATEALIRIMDYLFFDLKKHRITASIDPSNHDSIRLIERLGFRKEAHFRKSLFFHGKWVDDLIYAILAEEWKNRRDADI